MTAYITQADMEERFTPQEVRRLFIDDGSNTPGTSLAKALESASRRADMILRPAGWDQTAIESLVGTDEAVKDALCDIAMHFGTKRRLAWYVNGKAPYESSFKDAIATLKAIGQAELRPASEETAGVNPMYDERVNENDDPPFVFANGASGGY